ncbi:MAG: SDR family oxidoreductase [Pseudomonadota bacterium]
MGRALITGAARGLGLEIARALGNAGHDIMICDVDRTALDQAFQDLSPVSAQRCDISDPAEVASMFDRLEAAGQGIDILVNNAGTSVVKPFLDLTWEDWQRVMEINLSGAFCCAQRAAIGMRARGRGGRIVNITSISGQRGGTGRAAYGASKGGLETLTKVMAVELAEYGITCNAVAPGPVATELARATHSSETVATYENLIPLERYGTPEEVASAVVYLASNAASYITGQTLNVDGGFSAAGLRVKQAGPI